MADILDRLAEAALSTVASGYYRKLPPPVDGKTPSFVAALNSTDGPGLIAEVKPASPSGGKLMEFHEPTALVDAFAQSPVTGLSVLTEPTHFGGSLHTLRHAATKNVPVLFKDFVLDVTQLDAAAHCGASCVLLILSLFERGYSDLSLDEMIRACKLRNLDVLLEVYDAGEYERALHTNATMIGINNRNLKTLDVDIGTTQTVLGKHPKDRLVWGLSGVHTPDDVRFLRDCGVDACLVGTALMRSDQPQQLLESFLQA